jgi:fibronectin-binding autotransporter adhesin
MNTPCLLARLPAPRSPSTASALGITWMLLTPLATLAATDTWDGGGLNDILTTSFNWVDNTAPASDLANTDLIFAGAIRPTPILSAAFSAHSITFNNTATTFVIQGAQFNVGSGGITNNDTQTMSFTNAVNFGGVAASSTNAASGALNFTDTVTLPTGFLIVEGAHATSFADILGAAGASLGKFDAGTMTWTHSVGMSTSFDVDLQEGTLTLEGDASSHFFNSTASIDVTNFATLNVNENITLNGASLTRTGSGPANIHIAADKTLNVSNGATVDIAGNFSAIAGSTIIVAGAASTFATGTTFSSSGTVDVFGGGQLSSSLMNLSFAGNGSMNVDGGSHVSGGALAVGDGGYTGSINFRNGSMGTFSSIAVATSFMPGTTATLLIESGASVTGTGLFVAAENASTTGTVTVTGAGSSLALTGGSILGSVPAGVATVRVEQDADFHSGAGLTSMTLPASAIAIAGGNYHSHGNLTITAGSQLTRDSAGTFALDAGTTFTVQVGADAVFTGSYANTTASTIRVTGAGSTLSATNALSFNGGSTLNVESGGVVTAGSTVNVGTIGNGTATVTGSGSSLSGNTLAVGLNGATADLTFSSASTSAFGLIQVDASSTAGTSGTLTINSGATVTGTGLTVANRTVANTGAVTISGADSLLTLTGAATTTIGAASASTGTLTIENGGTFTTGTGLTMVSATGDLNILGGGTMIVRGNMVVKSALDIADGGVVILDATEPPSPGDDPIFDDASFRNDVASRAVPEPGIGALLLSAVALLGARHPKIRLASATRTCFARAGFGGGWKPAAPLRLSSFNHTTP